MLAIRCTLMRDSFEGGRWDDPTAAEWPPSPMRLFSALVSVANSDGTEDRVLRALEELPPPEIQASVVLDDADRVGWYRRAFVPTNSLRAEGGSTVFPARTNGERGWPRAIPRTPSIWYRWPGSSLGAGDIDALAEMCRRVPYLGRTTSPVVVEVSDEVVDDLEPLKPASGTVVSLERARSIRCPYPGALDALRAAHEAKYLRGGPGDPWEVGCQVEYGLERAVATERVVTGPYSSMVVLALRSPGLDGRHAARVAYHVRRALMSRAEEHIAVLHGHHDGALVQCAVLALPFVGTAHADGHLLGIAIALPSLSSPDARVLAGALPPTGETFLVRAGALGILEFERRTAFDAAERSSSRVWGLDPDRWVGPARVWATALPVVLDRFLKPGDDVTDAVRHAVSTSGLPEPEAIVISRRPQIPGAIDLHPSDTVRRPTDRGFRPYRHVTLRFSDPVRGPVVIGSMRHYGLGLCIPITKDEA